MAKEIAVKKSAPLAKKSDTESIMAIISRAASDTSFDVAKLAALLDVKDRWEKEEARKEFVSAMTAFKANPPEVVKNMMVNYGTTRYKHASLDQASSVIGGALAEHGISHRWSVDQDGGKIAVKCVLTHARGHSETVSMQAPADQSGSKNAIQAIGSAVTYLQRYTLLAAAGIAVSNKDDDDGGKAIPAPSEDGPQSVTILPSPKIAKKGGEYIATAEPGGDKYYIADEATARQFHDAGKAGEKITFSFDIVKGKRMVVCLA